MDRVCAKRPSQVSLGFDGASDDQETTRFSVNAMDHADTRESVKVFWPRPCVFVGVKFAGRDLVESGQSFAFGVAPATFLGSANARHACGFLQHGDVRVGVTDNDTQLLNIASWSAEMYFDPFPFG